MTPCGSPAVSRVAKFSLNLDKPGIKKWSGVETYSPRKSLGKTTGFLLSGKICIFFPAIICVGIFPSVSFFSLGLA